MGKFKIISDETGQTCQVFVDGKQIERISSIRITRTQVSGEYGLILEAIQYRTDEKGKLITKDGAILEDVLCYDFSKPFSDYMNPSEDGD